MELAESFAGKKPPATLYFLFTGSEEYGGLDMTGAGCKAFYRKHSHEIENYIAHLDIDDIGNLLGSFQLFVAGPKAFRDTLKAIPSPFNIRCGIRQRHPVIMVRRSCSESLMYLLQIFSRVALTFIPLMTNWNMLIWGNLKDICGQYSFKRYSSPKNI